MHKFLRLIVLVFLLTPTFPELYSFGEEEAAYSLSDCLGIGLANNLHIKIAKIDSKIKGQDIPLSESIFDTILSGDVNYTDDQRAAASTLLGTESLTNYYGFGVTKKILTGTELTLDYYDEREWTDSAFVANNPSHTAELSFTLKQPVLKNFFGYVDRRGVKLSRIEADLAGIKALDKIENEVADIEKAYWQLVFTYQNVALRKELLSQADQLYKTFKGHLKTGAAETTEIYETEANVQIRKTELEIAKNDLKTASNKLKLLLNEDGSFLILPRDRLEFLGGGAEFVKSLNDAIIASREYRMKKKELAAKKVKVKMKKNSLWPEVDLVGTFAVNGVDTKFEKANRRLTTDKFPKYYAGVKVSFPLENRQARSEYNKAKLEKKKAILELIQTEKDIVTDIDEKVRGVNLNLENARRWTRIKEIQHNKFKEEEKKLKYGRSNSKTIIDYQKDLAVAAINEYNAILQYYLALIELENTKDTLLEKVGVLNL